MKIAGVSFDVSVSISQLIPSRLNFMSIFYDTHTHLDYQDYANDLPEVIERAGAAGITKNHFIGTDLESSARAIKLAERSRAFSPPSAGIRPMS